LISIATNIKSAIRVNWLKRLGRSRPTDGAGSGVTVMQQRRQVLGGLSVAAVGMACWPRVADARFENTLAERLVGVFREPARAARVGRVYLAAHPEAGNVDWLTADLVGDLRQRGCAPERSSCASLRTALSRQVHEDFTGGRVVQVDGWFLSATEAKLCGMAALVGTA
jgi:hypothetical protein